MAEREIIGNDLVLLVLYRVSLPKSTQSEVSAFLSVMKDEAMNQAEKHSRFLNY